MMKQIFALVICVVFVGQVHKASAQSNKNKKSRYYQNSTTDPEFNVKGFYRENEKNEVDAKPKEDEYDVKISSNEKDSKYKDEQRIRDEEREARADAREKRAAERAAEREAAREERAKYQAETRDRSYPTTYGGRRTYNENRASYDKYYGGNYVAPATVASEEVYEQPAPAPKRAPRPAKKAPRKEKEIKMTSNEVEYQTTVVRKRYTNLDVLCDDLDLAKIQRPVFKGICSECSRDVDLIIVNKNMSSLEKNYNLKQCYMMRDKRLREICDDAQYKKWLRIKDADEYLILTKDPELKDGVNK